jgi:hypothetical protein
MEFAVVSAISENANKLQVGDIVSRSSIRPKPPIH